MLIFKKIKYFFLKKNFLKDDSIFYEKSSFFSRLKDLYKLKIWEKDTKNGLKNNLGALLGLPNKIFLKYYCQFLQYNPNNLGNWSDFVQKNTIREAEYEVIKKMINLYKGNDIEWGGYITSGGTEGNFFSVWLAKSYLMKFLSLNKICLLKTSLTHYSIDKIASIIGLSQFIIALDKNLGMDINDLENKINSLSKKGYLGFIIVLTLGYSVSGTRDNYKKINRFLKNLEKKDTNLKFYCFIDAASDGMVEPFFNKKFKPLNFSHIFSFVVDFHKFGMAAYPAGLVLYKKKLISLISKNISYLEEKDETLLGSRQGAVAVALWVLINFLGKEGFRKVYEKQFNNKTYFVNEIKKIIPKIKITENKYSLILGLIFKDNKQIPQDLCNRYNIYPANVKILFFKKNRYIEKKIKIYKICFMPYLNKKNINSFLANLKKYYIPNYFFIKFINFFSKFLKKLKIIIFLLKIDGTL